MDGTVDADVSEVERCGEGAGDASRGSQDGAGAGIAP